MNMRESNDFIEPPIYQNIWVKNIYFFFGCPFYLYPEIEDKVRIIFVERRFPLTEQLNDILDRLIPISKKKIDRNSIKKSPEMIN